MSRRWGPFSEGMGAEMELAPPARAEGAREGAGRWGGATRVWYHPSYASTAATLRAIWERVRASRLRAESRPVSGAVMLPIWPGAAWRDLTRGMRLVKVWPAGSPVLEEWRGGVAGWTTIRTLSDTGLFTFPLRAGPAPAALGLDVLEAGTVLLRRERGGVEPWLVMSPSSPVGQVVVMPLRARACAQRAGAGMYTVARRSTPRGQSGAAPGLPRGAVSFMLGEAQTGVEWFDIHEVMYRLQRRRNSSMRPRSLMTQPNDHNHSYTC